MKNKTLSSKLFIIFLIVVGLLLTVACGAFTIKAANYDNSPDDWRGIDDTYIEYKNFKNIFVKQKQLIIDAYNAQVSKLSEEGLKTKTIFLDCNSTDIISKIRLTLVKILCPCAPASSSK